MQKTKPLEEPVLEGAHVYKGTPQKEYPALPATKPLHQIHKENQAVYDRLINEFGGKRAHEIDWQGLWHEFTNSDGRFCIGLYFKQKAKLVKVKQALSPNMAIPLYWDFHDLEQAKKALKTIGQDALIQLAMYGVR